MKKLIFFIIIIIIGLVSLYLNNIGEQNLGKGYKYIDNGFDYWQFIVNKDGDEVIPVKVIEYHSDDKYIVAVRIIIEIYECYVKNTIGTTSSSSVYNDTINKKRLQYWLIDKEKEIAYVSETKEKIEEKITLFSSSLSFKDKDYKDNSYMKGVKGKLNSEYKCILTNDPFEDSVLLKVINLDPKVQRI